MADNLGEAKGYVKLDIAGFKTGMEKLETYIQNVENSLTGLEQFVSRMNASIAQTLNLLSGNIQAVNTNLNSFGQSFNASANSVTSTVQNLADSVSQSASNISELQAVSNSLGSSFQASESGVKELANKLDDANESLDDFEEGLEDIQKTSQETQTGLKGLNDKLDETDKKTKDAVPGAKAFESAFKKAASIVTKAFAALATTVTGALTAAVAIGSQFEASMSQVAATMGITASEIAAGSEAFEALSNAAQDMGARTRYTASQAAEALNYLALAGYNVQESVETLPKVLNLASAGAMDLGRASDMITDSIAALGLGLGDIDRLIDQMAVTAQKSNTSVSQLGDAILTVGGTAKILKGGTTELATALGILANNGIKASEGGTALRQIILNLTTPTDKAKAKLEDLRVNAFDPLTGSIRGLNEIFGDLAAALEGATDEEMMDALGTIFDARQLKSATALLANYSDSWDELSGYIQSADGAASSMSETLTVNLQGSMTKFRSGMEAVGIQIYDVFQEKLATAMNSGVTSVQKLQDALKSPILHRSLENLSDEASNLVEKALTKLSDDIIPGLITGTAFFIDHIQAIATGAGVAAAGILLLNTNLIAAAASTALLNNECVKLAIALLSNPYTAVAAALGILVTAVISAKKEHESLINALRKENSEYQDSLTTIQNQQKALDELNSKMHESVQATDSEAERVNILVERLRDYVDESGKVVKNESAVKQIISEINSIYPDFISYTEGQIQNYDKLNDSLIRVNENMRAQAILQGRTEVYQEASKIYGEAAAKQDQLAENVENTGKAYDAADKRITEYYQALADNRGVAIGFEEDYQEAVKHGFKSTIDYLEAQKQVTGENWADAIAAQNANEKILKESLDTMEAYENDLVKMQMDAGVEINGVYRNQAEARVGVAQKEAERQAEINRKTSEKETADRTEAVNAMWSQIDELDRKWQLRQLGSEEEYQAERKRILESGRDEYNEDWVREYNKALVYEEKQNEQRLKEQENYQKEQRKNFEDSIKEQISDLEYRNKVDNEYTEEMMYRDMETIRDGLSAEDDLYKEINQKIVLGRKKLSEDLTKQEEKSATAQQKAAEKSFKTWSTNFNKIISDTEKQYKKATTSQDNLEKQLNDYVNLYTTTTKKIRDKTTLKETTQQVMEVSTKSLKEQIKALEAYKKSLQRLRDSGASQELIDEVIGMGVEKGSEFAKTLNEMSTTELKKYISTYDDLAKENAKFAEEFYKSEVDSLKKNFVQEIDKAVKDLPKDFNLVGTDTIDGFLQGLESKKDETTGVINTVMDDVIASARKALDSHSPSRKFTEIGEDTIDGQIVGVQNKQNELLGVYKDLGKSVINSMLEGMQSAWVNVASWLKSSIQTLQDDVIIPEMANRQFSSSIYTSPANYTPLVSTTPTTIQSVQGSGLTKADIIDAIKTAQPDGDIILQVDKYKFGLISRSSLNTVAESSGDLSLRV